MPTKGAFSGRPFQRPAPATVIWFCQSERTPRPAPDMYTPSLVSKHWPRPPRGTSFPPRPDSQLTSRAESQRKQSLRRAKLRAHAVRQLGCQAWLSRRRIGARESRRSGLGARWLGRSAPHWRPPRCRERHGLRVDIWLSRNSSKSSHGT